MEERIDKIIISRKLVTTRVRAEEIIKKYGVMVDGKLINKPGKKVSIDASIKMLQEEMPYVSRGAMKLKHAVEDFEIDCKDKVCLDLGASTGGFSQILLENGAKKIFCVDVGKNQLHKIVKENPAIVDLEKTHVRELSSKKITESCQLLVIDVSFISLEKVLPFVHQFIDSGSDAVLLIKPQFEVGKALVGKGGVVKDKQQYPKVIHKIKESAKINHFDYIQHCDSPILGGDGNKEFLMHLKKR